MSSGGATGGVAAPIGSVEQGRSAGSGDLITTRSAAQRSKQQRQSGQHGSQPSCGPDVSWMGCPPSQQSWSGQPMTAPGTGASMSINPTRMNQDRIRIGGFIGCYRLATSTTRGFQPRSDELAGESRGRLVVRIIPGRALLLFPTGLLGARTQAAASCSWPVQQRERVSSRALGEARGELRRWTGETLIAGPRPRPICSTGTSTRGSLSGSTRRPSLRQGAGAAQILVRWCAVDPPTSRRPRPKRPWRQ